MSRLVHLSRIAPEIQAAWLSQLLEAVATFESEHWTWSRRTMRTMKRLVGNETNWRALTRREREAVRHELKTLAPKMEAIADRREVTIPIDGVSFVTRFSAGQPKDQVWTWDESPTTLTPRMVAALDSAAIRRCPRCRRLFATVRDRRGAPQLYCPDTPCGQTARTQRWRESNPETFRERRRASYKRRLERRLKQTIKIQRHRGPNDPGRKGIR
jgi:hypothetical protein